MWKKRLQDEPNDFHREDWFFAQLCMEVYLIRKSLTGGKVDRKLEDYILKFSTKVEEKKEVLEDKPVAAMDLEEYQASREEYSKRAMAEWMSAFGAVGNQQPPPTKSPEKLMDSVQPPGVPAKPQNPPGKRRKGVRVGNAATDAQNRSEMPLSDENDSRGGVSVV